MELDIVRSLLLASPPGEIQFVLKDINVIAEDFLPFPDNFLHEIFRTYHFSTGFTLELNDNHKLIIAKENEIMDENHYVDAKRNCIVHFDHVQQRVLEDSIPITEAEDVKFEDKRLALEEALDKYSKTKYSGKAATGCFEKENMLVGYICCEKLNLKNFWCGRWMSRWEIDPSTMQLLGTVKLFVHYFENGNLQLHTEKSIQETINATENDFGKQVVNVIQNAENAIQTDLESMYANMPEETFKEMRRVMPLTRTKMDWSVHAHRTAKSLKK